MTLASNGFAVIPDVLSSQEIVLACELVEKLVARYRTNDEKVVTAGVSVAALTEKFPHRNPGVDACRGKNEPFIIGNLIAMDARFIDIFSKPKIWVLAAKLLECSLEEVVFHISNLTRKPSFIGPGIGWHRDATNTYFSAMDRRTIRLIFPLQNMSSLNGGTAVVQGSHLHTAPEVVENPIDYAVSPFVAAGACLAIHADLLHGGLPNRGNCERDLIVLQFGVRYAALSNQNDEFMSLCGLDEFKFFSAKLHKQFN